MTKAEDEQDGINLTRMQFETVETVENLQLHIIQLQKEINYLMDKNRELEFIKAEHEAIKTFLKPAKFTITTRKMHLIEVHFYG